MRNFSSDKFGYFVRPSDKGGDEIVLTYLETGQQKVFYQASGVSVSADGTNCHMESMTDSLLLQFFEKKGGKSKKKGKKDEQED